ncbi:MAG: PilZ domain-containing protein [Planctomycetes bacterium]|nr:PilZ domain-containing protein [Planctomycetota bacterium]
MKNLARSREQRGMERISFEIPVQFVEPLEDGTFISSSQRNTTASSADFSELGASIVTREEFGLNEEFWICVESNNEKAFMKVAVVWKEKREDRFAYGLKFTELLGVPD